MNEENRKSGKDTKEVELMDIWIGGLVNEWDSAVPSGRMNLVERHQTLRVWLISGCASGTSRKRE